jgi:hypothetical protein
MSGGVLNWGLQLVRQCGAASTAGKKLIIKAALSFPGKELNMTDDRELAKKCAFDARTLLNDMQGKGHIDELKLLKAMQLLVNAVQALAAEK